MGAHQISPEDEFFKGDQLRRLRKTRLSIKKWFVDCPSILQLQGNGMSQFSFSDMEYGAKRKKTKWKIFLAEMDSVTRWGSIIKLV